MMGGKGAYKGTGTDVSEGSQGALDLQEAQAQASPFDLDRQLEMADEIITSWTTAFQEKCVTLDYAHKRLRLEKEENFRLKQQVRTFKEAGFLAILVCQTMYFCLNLCFAGHSVIPLLAGAGSGGVWTDAVSGRCLPGQLWWSVLYPSCLRLAGRLPMTEPQNASCFGQRRS